MTEEEAIKGLKAFRREFSGYEPNEEMFDMAIKALEQEPILDKIRAEIDENIKYNKKMNYIGIVGGLLLSKNIINKYKAESEGKE